MPTWIGAASRLAYRNFCGIGSGENAPRQNSHKLTLVIVSAFTRGELSRNARAEWEIEHLLTYKMDPQTSTDQASGLKSNVRVSEERTLRRSQATQAWLQSQKMQRRRDWRPQRATYPRVITKRPNYCSIEQQYYSTRHVHIEATISHLKLDYGYSETRYSNCLKNIDYCHQNSERHVTTLGQAREG